MIVSQTYKSILARLERLEKRKAEAAQLPKPQSPPLPWDQLCDGSAAPMEQWAWLFERSDIIDVPDLPRVNGLRELPPDGGQRP
jgi:hypothetical protein